MAMRGRPAFQPTDEQRKNVEVMVGLGIPEDKICLLVRDRRDTPISRNSLRKHFKKELETGATKLNAQVGNFMVVTIMGAKPPAGVTPIRDERVLGRRDGIGRIASADLPAGVHLSRLAWQRVYVCHRASGPAASADRTIGREC